MGCFIPDCLNSWIAAGINTVVPRRRIRRIQALQTLASADADANISLEDRNSSASGGEGTTVLSQGQNNVASRVAGDKKGSSLTAETVEDAGLGDR